MFKYKSLLMNYSGVQPWFIIIMIFGRVSFNSSKPAVQQLVAAFMSCSSSITCVLSAFYCATVKDSSITLHQTITHFGGTIVTAVFSVLSASSLQ